MLLPTTLQHILEEAYDLVQQHTQHALLPIVRRKIYEALGPWKDQHATRVRTKLAALTLQHILPLWYEQIPNDDWPKQLLSIVEGVLQDKVDPDRVLTERYIALGRLEETKGHDQLRGNAFYVMSAAVDALYEAWGGNHLTGVYIDEQTTDADLDPWSSDVAKWGATAYAGGVWDSSSDSLRRKEFWEWWLMKAVPDAWSTA